MTLATVQVAAPRTTLRPDTLTRPRRPAPQGAAASEEDLANALAGGEEWALAELLERRGTLVHTLSARVLSARVLGDRQDAEDVIQQAFPAAWRGRDTYRPERGTLPGRLVGITRKVAADAPTARARRREPAAAGSTFPPAVAGPHPDEVPDRLLVAHAPAGPPTRRPVPPVTLR
ncbi:sigma factor [Streptomyces pini]|uniref:RNA polymerase sigma-70 factor, ECF subfamily n=1 Tax=Streptomyces pini TaxID=1520580 RepID=A0A1I3TY27_9ACTN|nr:sigma factor [Streptomyces pini]SFJ75665.1 RNA polymerase sigma-70 factor, ECF subfamily [Streptomyces pini]